VSKDLFDIAIYRVSEERFKSQHDSHLADYLASLARQTGGEISPRLRGLIEARYLQEWGPWQFNQIIGWLRLHACRFAVNADVWLSDAKTYQRRMRNKRFCLYGTEPVVVVAESLSSDEIHGKVVAELSRFSRAWRRKGFFVDLGAVIDSGAFFNWHGFLSAAGKPRRRVNELYKFRGTRLDSS
jgi:hypothetical protein